MTKKQVKISVVVPVYNVREDWLRKAVESLLHQTLEDIEVILVNDGSTDQSPGICDEYADKDPRVRVLHQENRGVGGARNAGLKAASGKYVLFVDADDWIKTMACEKLYQKAEQNGLDVLFCGTIGYWDHLDDYFIYDDFSRLPRSVIEKSLSCNNDEILDHLFSMNTMASSKLLNKDFLLQNNLFFVEKMYFEDTEFFFRFVLRAKRFGFIPDGLHFYRMNVANSIIGSKDDKHFDILRSDECIRNTMQREGVFERLKEAYYNTMICTIYYRYDQIKKEYKKEFKKLIVKHFKRHPLTREELQMLTTGAGKAYGYFMQRSLFLKNLLQESVRRRLTKVRKKKCAKRVRVEYSWDGDDALHNWIFDDIEFTTKKIGQCDLLLSLNAPRRKVKVRAKQAWCLTFEPPVEEVMDIFARFFDRYDKVYTACRSKDHPGIIPKTALSEWWIGKSHYELLNLPLLEKEDHVVWVTSNMSWLEGHRKRLEFLDYVQKNTSFKIYGKGIDPVDSKWKVIRHAKYVLGVENTLAEDYWTEKIADSFLAYAMPVYYGCPNIEKYFPREAIIKIDIEKPEEAIRIIQKAIEDRLWEKNFAAVVQARQMVLNEYWYPRFVMNEMKKIDFDHMHYKKISIP